MLKFFLIEQHGASARELLNSLNSSKISKRCGGTFSLMLNIYDFAKIDKKKKIEGGKKGK